MNKFISGDLVNWATNFGDNDSFTWPGTVISTYAGATGDVVQFYIRKKGDPKGMMRVKEWLCCHLKPHEEKPRYKLVPVASLREGDIVWSENYAHDSTISALEEEVILKNPDVKWSGKRYAWKKQTALQTHLRSPGGRGHLNPRPVSGGHPCNISRTERDPRLDEGAGGADAVPREGYSSVADYVQATAQPRASLRMTQGRHIKGGEYVSFEVHHSSFDGSRHININNAMIKIDPNRYYYVVNQLTK